MARLWPFSILIRPHHRQDLCLPGMSSAFRWFAFERQRVGFSEGMTQSGD